jgi:O-antigen/teichoic acid export membrane protein
MVNPSNISHEVRSKDSVRQDLLRNPLAKKTLFGLVWAGSEAASRTLIQFAVLIVLAHLLTPEDYGVVGAALVVVGISTIFAQLGVGPALVQRNDLEARHLLTAFSFSIFFGLISALVVFLLAPFLANFCHMPLLKVTLQVLSLIFPIASISLVSEAMLQRELKFRRLAVIEVSSYFIGYGCVAIILALMKFGLWSLVAGQLVQISSRSVQLLLAAKWSPRFGFDRKSLDELWRFSGGQTFAQIANYVASGGDAMVVSKFLGANAAGLYMRAYQLMLTPALLVGAVLEKVLFPALSRVQDRPELLAHAYRQGNRLLAVLILPPAATSVMIAPDLIPFALGQRWQGVVLPLQLFSLGLLWRTGMKMSNSIIRACGAVNLFAICQTFYAITTLSFAWIASRWGIPGVCIGVLTSIFICYSLTVWLSLSLTKVTATQFITDHLPAFLLTAMVVLTGYGLTRYEHTHPLPTILELIMTLSGVVLCVLTNLSLFPRFFLGTEGNKIREKVLNRTLRRAMTLNKHLA